MDNNQHGLNSAQVDRGRGWTLPTGKLAPNYSHYHQNGLNTDGLVMLMVKEDSFVIKMTIMRKQNMMIMIQMRMMRKICD